MPMPLGAGDVALEVVADHPGELRIGVERLERGREVRGARLAEDGRLDLRRVLEACDEGARVEQRARASSATSGCGAGSRARRAGLELGERAREVHVREDAVRLGGLVGAADEDGVGALADELEALEIVDERVHREREHPLAAEELTAATAASSGSRRRSSSTPMGAELFGELRARAGSWCS